MRTKVYVLMISKVFPATHPRRGQDTRFREKIENAVYHSPVFSISNVGGQVAVKHEPEKIHTMRPRYDLWAARAEKINAGEAVLSLRQWTGKPYASKQQEFMQLTKLNVQLASFYIYQKECRVGIQVDDYKGVDETKFIKNDGLSKDDFISWFGMGYHKGMALINFTDHKY